MSQDLESRKAKALVAGLDLLCEAMEAVMPSFHACENPGANCIDFLEHLAGTQGHVCWCECHPWNQPPKERAMSANPELEKLLESVAREADHVEGWESIFIVLKARLLPILEAGQALRDNIHVNWFVERGNWDAALRAAMDAKL